MNAIRKALRKWWECRTKRCAYYSYYLADGPADLTHIGFHSAEKLATAHFKNCRADWAKGNCRTCIDWEKRLRA